MYHINKIDEYVFFKNENICIIEMPDVSTGILILLSRLSLTETEHLDAMGQDRKIFTNLHYT